MNDITLNPPVPPSTLRRLVGEPLVHFIVLGGLLFGLDAALSRFRDDGKTIVVGESVKNEARDIFRGGMGRDPALADMKIMVDRWVDNEVLYREGLALMLDRGDPSIRERVIFKALSVTQSGLSLPPVTDAELKTWFEKQRQKYDAPPRYDFVEAVVAGDNSQPALQAFVNALNGKGKSDLESSLRVFKGRPRNNLVTSYGEEFTKALEGSKPDVWMLLAGGGGQHVVRLEAMQPGIPVNFEDVKDVVQKDWREQTMAQLTTNAVREMGKKYKIREEQAKP